MDERKHDAVAAPTGEQQVTAPTAPLIERRRTLGS